jgi:hypothetical protein
MNIHRKVRTGVSALLWAASAYAALAYVVPALRFGALDYEAVGPAVRWRIEAERRPYDPYDVEWPERLALPGQFAFAVLPISAADGTNVSSHGGWNARLWGIALAPGMNPYNARGSRGHGRRQTILAHGRDRTGLVAVDVRDTSGYDAGVSLVSQGFASWDRQEAPHAEHLRRAEEEARAAHRGMWAAPQQARENRG